MKKLLLATVAILAIAGPAMAFTNQNHGRTVDVNDGITNLTCHPEHIDRADHDPVVRTYITVDLDSSHDYAVKSFEVRHESLNGRVLNRDDQYTGRLSKDRGIAQLSVASSYEIEERSIMKNLATFAVIAAVLLRGAPLTAHATDGPVPCLGDNRCTGILHQDDTGKVWLSDIRGAQQPKLVVVVKGADKDKVLKACTVGQDCTLYGENSDDCADAPRCLVLSDLKTIETLCYSTKYRRTHPSCRVTDPMMEDGSCQENRGDKC